MNPRPSRFSSAAASLGEALQNARGDAPRRGSILIVAILVLFTLSSLVLVLCRSMAVEALASANEAAALQASVIEQGAEQYVIAAILDQGAEVLQLEEADFAGVQVGDGYFWVMRPPYAEEDNLPVYGLVDEGSKLSVNEPTRYEALMKLPNMTDEVAASIIAWRSSGEDTGTGNGAGNEYYLSLSPPYTLKQGPFETLEEMLLVKGVTHELLYGQASTGGNVLGNTGGTSSGGATMSGVFGDEWTQRGLADLLTVYSASPRTDPAGAAKIVIGGQGQQPKERLQTLMQQKSVSNYAGIMSSLGTSQLNDTFDLLGAPANMPAEEFAKIADFITISAGNANAASRPLPGRINVNTAPREVLACLPNLSTTEVNALLSQRTSSDNTSSTSIGWVAVALKTKAIGLGAFITGSTSRYSADILAVNGTGRAFKRCRIVIDTSGAAPKVIYRRDLTDRGWPLDKQVLTSLRSGQGPGDWSAGIVSSSGSTGRTDSTQNVSTRGHSGGTFR